MSWVELFTLIALAAIAFSLSGIASSLSALSKQVDRALESHAQQLERDETVAMLDRIAMQVARLAKHAEAERAEVLLARAHSKSEAGEPLTGEEVEALKDCERDARFQALMRQVEANEKALPKPPSSVGDGTVASDR